MQGLAQGHKQSHTIGKPVTIKSYDLWYGDHRPPSTLTPMPTPGSPAHAGIDLLQELRKLPTSTPVPTLTCSIVSIGTSKYGETDYLCYSNPRSSRSPRNTETTSSTPSSCTAYRRAVHGRRSVLWGLQWPRVATGTWLGHRFRDWLLRHDRERGMVPVYLGDLGWRHLDAHRYCSGRRHPDRYPGRPSDRRRAVGGRRYASVVPRNRSIKSGNPFTRYSCFHGNPQAARKDKSAVVRRCGFPPSRE